MHTAAAVAGTYRRTEIQSRSPLELVVMLYDGAASALLKARDALERRDVTAKRDGISRALAIVAELQNTLNMDAGGQIAASLDELYSYVNGRLIEANQRDDVSAIDDALKVLNPLREAWTELANPVQDAPADTGEPR